MTAAMSSPPPRQDQGQKDQGRKAATVTSACRQQSARIAISILKNDLFYGLIWLDCQWWEGHDAKREVGLDTWCYTDNFSKLAAVFVD